MSSCDQKAPWSLSKILIFSLVWWRKRLTWMKYYWQLCCRLLLRKVFFFLVKHAPLQLGNTTRPVRKVSSHFEYLENRSRGLDVTWQPVRGDHTVHSLSRGASQSAVRRCWLSLCTVWLPHLQISTLSTAILALGKARSRREPNFWL